MCQISSVRFIGRTDTGGRLVRVALASMSRVELDLCSGSRCSPFNLVDPASSHMLVSKIKPCMSQYTVLVLLNCEWLIKTVMVYLTITHYVDILW